MTRLVVVTCFLVAACWSCAAQLVGFPSAALSAPSLGQAHSYYPEAQVQAVLPHQDVIQNAEREAQLPAHLHNPFYKNPRIAEALARESWLGPGESPVYSRETHKIPRERIFSVLRNAGLARRR